MSRRKIEMSKKLRFFKCSNSTRRGSTRKVLRLALAVNTTRPLAVSPILKPVPMLGITVTFKIGEYYCRRWQ